MMMGMSNGVMMRDDDGVNDANRLVVDVNRLIHENV